jgi:hypothetical protein
VRESLTVLAGLLVLSLLAALIAPGFVDWRGYRPQIEARLTQAFGIETTVAGGIGLRILPSPRLTLSEVRVGSSDGAASSAEIETVTVEIALAPLARRQIHISQTEIEGATIRLVLDEQGALKLPPKTGSGPPAEASLDRLSLSRSAVIWREAGREPVTVTPVAAEASAVSLAGPWRVEGEAAGASFRLTTGTIEADGKLRAKLSVTGDVVQLGFDGSFLLPAKGGVVGFGLDGGFTLSPGGAVSLAGRVGGGGRQLDLTGLTLDLGGGAARLEGEGHYLPATGNGSLALRARRLDLDALIGALGERAGFERALAGLPGIFDTSLDLDQLVWRGEDFSAFALRGKLDESGLSEANASVRVAGALVGASGSADFKGVAGRLNLKAEDSRRLALVMARAGLDAALADMVAGLGRIDAEAVGAWEGGRLAFERLFVTGASGLRLDGSGDWQPERFSAHLALQGLDLNTLPPGESFAGLLGRRDLALDLTLTQARFRNAPPGSASLDLRREGANWRLRRLSVEGFGGVSVNGSGALLPEGGEITGRIAAPRFETLAALAGPLLPDAVRQPLARAGDALTRLDAGFRVTRTPAGETGLTLDGAAQAGKLSLTARLDAAETWREAQLGFELADRRLAFAALGLPVPAQGGAGRFVLRKVMDRLTGSLAGSGLSLSVEGDGRGTRLDIQAEQPGQILPEGAARLLPDGLFDMHARLGFSGDAISLDDLVANLGTASARGALSLSREAGLSGRLVLPSLDLRALLAASLGQGAPTPGQIWSTARFGPALPLPEFDLAIEADAVTVTDGVVWRGAGLSLQGGRDGLRIEDLRAAYGGGSVAGRLSLRREGGLAQMSGRLALAGVDLAPLTGAALGGKLSGQIEAGGSGETPARLIAALGGAGSVTLTAAMLARFDPSAYGRVIAGTGEDASESEVERLQGRLGEALDRGAWALGEITAPFTIAGGLARLQGVSFERNGLRAEATGVVDLRALTGDLRLGLKPLGRLPKDWPGEAPQIGVAWRGPLSNLKREADVGALSNMVAARALAREIERVEAFEADARERAANSRRLRAERETRENERKLAEFLKAEEERRLAEEKRAEEMRRLEDIRRVAEEKRAEEARRIEEARQEQEARRRAEAEERARAAAARAAIQQPQPGPLVLPGAPAETTPEQTLQPAPPGNLAPPLPPPVQIETVPRPLSRSVQPN